jgi:hypothetical protein
LQLEDEHSSAITEFRLLRSFFNVGTVLLMERGLVGHLFGIAALPKVASLNEGDSGNPPRLLKLFRQHPLAFGKRASLSHVQL